MKIKVQVGVMLGLMFLGGYLVGNDNQAIKELESKNAVLMEQQEQSREDIIKLSMKYQQVTKENEELIEKNERLIKKDAHYGDMIKTANLKGE